MIDSGQNRVFHYAILASLALHALLLLGFPDLIDRARRAASFPAPLIARLMEPEPAAPPASPPASPPPAPEKKVELAKPAPRLVKPAPRAPEPAPVVPAPMVEPPAPPAESPTPPQPVPAPVPSIATAPQPAAPSAAVASAAESLSRDQYRLQLIDEAARHKRYPPLARENNWQGVVGISVAVAASGRASVSLKSSSGHEVIDRQALEMFRAAANAVQVPPPLRGSAFALDLRVRYNLED